MHENITESWFRRPITSKLLLLSLGTSTNSKLNIIFNYSPGTIRICISAVTVFFYFEYQMAHQMLIVVDYTNWVWIYDQSTTGRY